MSVVVSSPDVGLMIGVNALLGHAGVENGYGSELPETEWCLSLLETGQAAFRAMDRVMVRALRQQGLDNDAIVTMMELNNRCARDIVAAFFSDDVLAIIEADPKQAIADEQKWLAQLRAQEENESRLVQGRCGI